MKILLLGSNGQVGWELQRALAPLGQLVICDRHSGDLENLQGLRELVEREQPAVIVNAAAYTAVDKAETDVERARKVNAESVAVLAAAASKLNAWLVHYSTDYVFAGNKPTAYVEDDPTGPLNVYGQTKLEGEQAIRGSGCRHLILRTSWVYAARGGNFAKTMLRLAQERERLTVIDDQWGAPTGADLLADVTAHALRHLQQRPQDAGLYHCVAAGETNWNQYAKYVLAQAQKAQIATKIIAKEVAPVPTSAFPTPAVRPHNSRLSTHKLQSTFGLQMPHWQQGVARMLTEIL